MASRKMALKHVRGQILRAIGAWSEVDSADAALVAVLGESALTALDQGRLASAMEYLQSAGRLESALGWGDPTWGPPRMALEAHFGE